MFFLVFARARERERNGGGESGSNRQQATSGRMDGWVDGYVSVDTCRVADAFFWIRGPRAVGGVGGSGQYTYIVVYCIADRQGGGGWSSNVVCYIAK